MEGTIGEIRMFAGNFAPRTWALCQGQLLPINQNSALFSILGTIYGGDGRTTFALPDLRGRVPLGAGQGPGLSNYREGAKGGQESVTLTVAQMPAHNHSFNLADGAGDNFSGANNGLASVALDVQTGKTNQLLETFKASPGFTDKTLASNSIGRTGNNQAVNNMQPWLAIHYIICLQGIFPSRS